MSYYDAMTYITKEGGDIKKIRNMKKGDTYTFKTRSGKTGYVTKEEIELDEAMKYNFMVLDRDGRVMGMTTGEKDAERQAKGDNIRGVTGRVVKLRKPMAQTRGDRLIGMLPADNLGEALDKEDEPKVKGIIKKLKKASDAHAGQA